MLWGLGGQQQTKYIGPVGFLFIFSSLKSPIDKADTVVPRNLYNHMDRQAGTSTTGLFKSREMAGRSKTMLWWLGRKSKDDRKQIYIGPVCF